MATTYQRLMATDTERGAMVAAEDRVLEGIGSMLERHQRENAEVLEALRQRHQREREALQKGMQAERLEQTRRVIDDVVEAVKQREAGGMNPSLASRVTLVGHTTFAVPSVLDQAVKAARKGAATGTVPVALIGSMRPENPKASRRRQLFAVVDVSDVIGGE